MKILILPSFSFLMEQIGLPLIRSSLLLVSSGNALSGCNNGAGGVPLVAQPREAVAEMAPTRVWTGHPDSATSDMPLRFRPPACCVQQRSALLHQQTKRRGVGEGVVCLPMCLVLQCHTQDRQVQLGGLPALLPLPRFPPPRLSPAPPTPNTRPTPPTAPSSSSSSSRSRLSSQACIRS